MATIAQLLMTFSFKVVPATEGSLFSFVTPVLNVVFGAVLFAEKMHPRGWLGACLVTGACMYVSLANRFGYGGPGETSTGG